VAEARRDRPQGRFSVVGIVSGIKEIVTKKKHKMMTITVEDSEVSMQVVVFPEQTGKFGYLIKLDQPIVISGRFEEEEEEGPKMLLETAYSVATAPIRKISHKPSLNRYHLNLVNYEWLVKNAKTPCSFVLSDGSELTVAG
jgi:DNA polymerase III alpha subunit